MKKTILDATAGGRMMWFQKNWPTVIFMDERVRTQGFMRTRPNFEIQPDIIASYRKIPIKKKFNLVVFDPPHTIRKGTGGIIAERYGRLNLADWEQNLAEGFEQTWAHVKKYGFLIFKWCETDKKIKDIEQFFPDPPLFGTRTGKNNKTIWLIFQKIK